MLHLGVTGSAEPGLSKLALLSLVIKSSSFVTQPVSENHLISQGLRLVEWCCSKIEMKSEAWRHGDSRQAPRFKF